MPNRQLKQTIAMLKGIDQTVGLNPDQRRQLARAKFKLRFFWVPQIMLHVTFILVVYLSHIHLKHLDEVNAIYAAADKLDLALAKAESGQRGFLLTGKRIYLSDYRYYTRIARSRMDDLCVRIPANDYNHKLCRSLERELIAKLSEMDSTLEAANTGDYAKALEIVRTDSGLHITASITEHLANIKLEAKTDHAEHPGSCLIP